MSTPESSRKLESEAKDIFLKGVGNAELDDDGGNDIVTWKNEPWRYLSYGVNVPRKSGEDSDGNVLSVTRGFDLNVEPEKLGEVSEKIMHTKQALEELGFNMDDAGMTDISSYEIVLRKMVTIEQLLDVLKDVVRIIGFDE